MKLSYRAIQENDQATINNLIQTDTEGSADIARAVRENPSVIQLIAQDDNPVGLLVMEGEGEGGELSIFIAPRYRRQGIGTSAIQHAEAVCREKGIKFVYADHRTNLPAAVAFANKLGYGRQFCSALMTRSKPGFPMSDAPIRKYRDADYDVAHRQTNEAFHAMRVSVGDFPDSTVGQPSEESRKHWHDDADNIFIYERNGEIMAYGHLEGAELSGVSVETSRWGQGIGRAMVEYLCNEIYVRGHDEVTLWCVVGNSARHLYDKLGFVESHVSNFAKKEL